MDTTRFSLAIAGLILLLVGCNSVNMYEEPNTGNVVRLRVANAPFRVFARSTCHVADGVIDKTHNIRRRDGSPSRLGMPVFDSYGNLGQEMRVETDQPITVSFRADRIQSTGMNRGIHTRCTAPTSVWFTPKPGKDYQIVLETRSLNQPNFPSNNSSNWQAVGSCRVVLTEITSEINSRKVTTTEVPYIPAALCNR